MEIGIGNVDDLNKMTEQKLNPLAEVGEWIRKLQSVEEIK